jgi:choice-of-anchor B domain-containing protein
MCGFLRDAEPAETQLQSVSGRTPCVNGIVSASGKNYPCSQIDLMSFVSLAELNSAYGGLGDKVNDIWGWTNPSTCAEIAIIGMTSGTAFVDITDPENVIYLGKLPSHNNINSNWRVIKTYENYAYIVSEAGGHGMQVSQVAVEIRSYVTFSHALVLEGFFFISACHVFGHTNSFFGEQSLQWFR